MTARQRFILVNEVVRRNCLEAVRCADIGSAVSIGPASRSLDQNAFLHAICSDIAKSGKEWAGKPRTMEQWKVLLVSGHTKATDGEVEMVPGLEDEFVNIRESTARMSVGRAASLITYAIAFCDMNEIKLTETIRSGFYDEDRYDPSASSSRGSNDEAADTSLSVAASSPLPELEWLKQLARMLYAVANAGGDIELLQNQKRAVPPAEGQTDDARSKANKIYGQCQKVIRGEIPKETALRFIANLAGCRESDITN